jgi:hypothetical protein
LVQVAFAPHGLPPSAAHSLMSVQMPADEVNPALHAQLTPPVNAVQVLLSAQPPLLVAQPVESLQAAMSAVGRLAHWQSHVAPEHCAWTAQAAAASVIAFVESVSQTDT